MLAGVTALVVEDEYLIALEIQRVLETAGAVAVIGEASVAPDAGQDVFQLAIVSVRPDAHDEHQLCLYLRERGTAVVALSSDSVHAPGIPGLDTIPVVIKPFIDDELLAAAQAAVQAGRPDNVS